MAVLTATNITRLISGGGEQPIAFGDGGLLMEVWRIPAAAVNDTATITPAYITDIRTVMSQAPANHNLSTNPNPNVTLTVVTAMTSPSDVHIYGRR